MTSVQLTLFLWYCWLINTVVHVGCNKQAIEASKQLVETFQVEDMFKQAVGEIKCWVSS